MKLNDSNRCNFHRVFMYVFPLRIEDLIVKATYGEPRVSYLPIK